LAGGTVGAASLLHTSLSSIYEVLYFFIVSSASALAAYVVCQIVCWWTSAEMSGKLLIQTWRCVVGPVFISMVVLLGARLLATSERHLQVEVLKSGTAKGSSQCDQAGVYAERPYFSCPDAYVYYYNRSSPACWLIGPQLGEDVGRAWARMDCEDEGVPTGYWMPLRFTGQVSVRGAGMHELNGIYNASLFSHCRVQHGHVGHQQGHQQGLLEVWRPARGLTLDWGPWAITPDFRFSVEQDETVEEGYKDRAAVGVVAPLPKIDILDGILVAPTSGNPFEATFRSRTLADYSAHVSGTIQRMRSGALEWTADLLLLVWSNL